MIALAIIGGLVVQFFIVYVAVRWGGADAIRCTFRDDLLKPRPSERPYDDGKRHANGARL
jgi:hypothetical protein